jgi:DNA recombination protein RmuC
VTDISFLFIVGVLLTGLAIGAVIAWVLASGRGAARSTATLREAETRAAAATARTEELRGQVTSLERERDGLRSAATESERRQAAAEARVVEMSRHVDEERRSLDAARAHLSDVFKALAAEALSGSSQSFLRLAEEKFKTLRDEAAGDLDARRQAIQGLVTPLNQALDVYQRESRELEQRRQKELGTVGEQLRQVATSHAQLQSETSRLVTALRAPQVRGRWGEIALRRTAELAGMSAHCDFTEQETIAGESGRLRPDMIVHLPSNRKVVVDSKVPLTAYLEAVEATDDGERLRALDRHAGQVRQHVSKLAQRNYGAELAQSAEFVVLFIPNDSFLAAAAERDPDLLEWALAQQVVLATPVTFVALLRAIEHGWRQVSVTEHAQRISDAGRELNERLGVLVDHLSKMGGALGRAVESYNQAVGSFNSRLLPTARRLEQLGAATRQPTPDLEPIEQAVRQVAPERLDFDQVEDGK